MSDLPFEVREILRDVAHGVHGPDLSGRAAAAIVRRDLCPRCANTGHELLATPGTLAWGRCHGCATPPPGSQPDPAAPCLACGARRDAHPRSGTPYACEKMGFQEPPSYRCENRWCDWQAYLKPCERRCPRCGATVWKVSAPAEGEGEHHG
jgi:hypothetical protein